MRVKIYNRTHSKAAKALAFEMGINVTRKLHPRFKGLIINFANWKRYPYAFRNCKVLNPPEAIKLNSNKLNSLQLFQNIETTMLNKPTTYLKHELDNIQYPIVARTRYHKSGNGFWLCESKAEAMDAYREGARYFMSYIPIRREYRVHIFNGKLIDLRAKVKNEDAVVEHDDLIRSIHRGWKFVELRKDRMPQEIIDDCWKLMQEIGLHFAGVDIIMDRNKQYWILELNSSAGLSMRNTIKAYVNAIREEAE